ncbi:MAG TPA: YbaB/EbfC family nucleoid-associated protein [Firmicutes bacterium]|nr:YbaB/EbfC family nucleoid-associated protein [Bacillota bacterium]
MDNFMERLRSELELIQTGLKEKTVEATAADGLVKVTANGHQELTAVFLDPLALYPKNQAPLEEAVLEAVNEAIHLSRQLLREEISRLAGGINQAEFPDFF